MTRTSNNSNLPKELRLLVACSFVLGAMLCGSSSVYGQCGNYVVMLDEQGQPIVDSTHRQHLNQGGDRFSDHFGLNEWARIDPRSVPCHGPNCRQNQSLPAAPPWANEIRSANDQATLDRILRSGGGQRDSWPFPQDLAPFTVEPSRLDRPPRHS